MASKNFSSLDMDCAEQKQSSIANSKFMMTI